MFTIKDHLVQGVGVRHVTSPNIGGRIEPTLIVLHDTAGAVRRFSSVEWFTDPKCKTSAHVVVEIDGTITQMVPFDAKAFHAGESMWNGRKYCNGFSIGIEIVNPGKLSEPKGDTCKADGFKLDLAEVAGRPVAAESAACGRGYWLPYTEPQMAAVERLIRSLTETYATITEVVGHHDISPGRKIDPTPLMPWGRMRVALTPRPKIDAEAVKEVQTRLQSLGYHLGSIDGSWGPRTRSALRDFQEQAQLPVTGSADEATMGRLMRDDAPAAVTASRDEWTAKDLVESGSKQVVAAQGVKKAGLAIKLASAAAVATEAGSQAIGATDSASNAISGVESAISVAERGAGLATKIAPFLLKCAASPLIQLAGVTALIGFTVWLGGHRVVMNRLRAARTGQHVGV